MCNLMRIVYILVFGLSLPCVAGQNIDQSLPTEKATHVRIENLRGQVSISGASTDKITVQGELDQQAKDFVFAQKGGEIIIKVVLPQHLNGNDRDQGSKLVVTVPAQLNIEFSGVSSDVSLANLSGRVGVKTVSGDIKARELESLVELTSVSGYIKSQQLSGDIRLSTVSGDITDHDSSGSLSLKTVSGNIESKSTATEVTANTVSGAIDVSLATIDELNVSSVSGNFLGHIVLKDSGLVKMSSVSGDLDLVLNENVQASFRFNSHAGGDLINMLTSDQAQRAKYGPSAKLSFATGDGSGLVKASTVSGRIRVSAE